ncbi:MAG: peptidoglycan editing factor PgeF [Cocleimonas sp.]|nr:peptidoglycan editing factor PgeF [Cocleimonas sp.]
MYDSLNCSPSSDDILEKVIENRQRVMQALGASHNKEHGKEEAKLYGLYQIHSTKVYTISKDMPNDEYQKGDAMVTNERGVFLSVLGADCTPVLFSNTDGSQLAEGSIIGAAHAGWKGAVTGIIEAVVKEMCALGAKREEISACIGPTIHQSSYEVQQDFIDQFNEISNILSEPYLLEEQGRSYFDLPAYLREQCNRSGIKVEDLGLDTYKLKDEFFSYRRNTHEKLTDYGRQISVIGLL